MRAGIAFGSNLGDRLSHLKAARERVLGLSETNPPILCSPVYETDPVGCEEGAPRFFNAVMEIGYAGKPLDLLRLLRRIEAGMGRPSAHPLNASRTIDLDLLYLGDQEMTTAELVLPHPRMIGRRFVLQPLAQIRPELILPGETKPVSALLAGLSDPELVPAASQW